MKAKFTGHDTFPLRYGWLFKASNYLINKGKLLTSNEGSTRKAVVELGVGKNMVNAIRYWGECCGIISDDGETITNDAVYLFGNDKQKGKDPYLEHIGSIWLLHFWLNFNTDQLTAYRYFFNHSNVQHFEKAKLVEDCMDDTVRLTDYKVKSLETFERTVKKDFDCFLNTYCHKQITGRNKDLIDEDHFSSPLSELKLIKNSTKGFYVSDLSEQAELPIEIFIYSLIKYINYENAESKTTTMDFDSLLTKPCSPGRIFRLSESGLGQKLDEAQSFTKGDVSWIDSLGLRQIKLNESTLKKPNLFLNKYYGTC
jgi:hypothetical protein